MEKIEYCVPGDCVVHVVPPFVVCKTLLPLDIQPMFVSRKNSERFLEDEDIPVFVTAVQFVPPFVVRRIFAESPTTQPLFASTNCTAPRVPAVVSLSCVVHVAPPFVVWIIVAGETKSGSDDKESITAQPLFASTKEIDTMSLFAPEVYCDDQFVPPFGLGRMEPLSKVPLPVTAQPLFASTNCTASPTDSEPRFCCTQDAPPF